MIRRLGVLALLFTTMCGVGMGQGVALDATPPSRAQVLKLIAAMGVQENVNNSLMATEKRMKLAARASFQQKNPDADAATLKKLDDVFDSTPFSDFEGLSETLIPVYQKNLSAADVQAGIDFYSSESGRRLLEKVPVIIRESNESGGKLVQEKLKAYSEAIERKLEAFQSEVNKQKPASGKPNAAGDHSTSGQQSK